MMNYEKFLETKKIIDLPSGHSPEVIHDSLFDFQKAILKWAVMRGRAAIFADCGLGKTIIQLSWADNIYRHTKGNILILAPLAVSSQTVREGRKFGFEVNLCSSQEDIKNGINITNYEKLHKFEIGSFSGIVLDESSILKSFTGKIRNQIIETSARVPYKLACTATPSPNDYMELGNHSEFLGVMSRAEMLSTFFVHDSGRTSQWRLKGHAESEFWEWVCSWSVMVSKPSDIGFEDGKFILPGINYNDITIKTNKLFGENLFRLEAQTLIERRQARKETIIDRSEAISDVINNSDEQWIVWCNLNSESKTLSSLINDSIEITGSDNDDHKVNAAIDFISGNIKVLVSKPSILGFGLNLQNCRNMAFVGLSDSYEEYYQATRRCWRFGQDKEVNVYIVTSDIEGAVLENIKRKESEAIKMRDEMIKNTINITRSNIQKTERNTVEYKTDHIKKDGWELYLGDCIETIKEKIQTNSIHYSIFSPPFSNLYTYTNSERDIGNCSSDDTFHEHFKFLIKELFRVIMPGRLVSFHCMNMPAMKERDGFIGIKDFRGDLIRSFQDEGFIFHSEVVIWKDPLIEAVRTKALGLLHKQLCKDSSRCRQGIPDYLITMRKPGENPAPVNKKEGFTNFIGEDEPKDGVYSHQVWRKYASPVWMDINQTRTLNFRTAREEKDEKHICPLQLDVIGRAIHLWTNEGDIVLSPFAGIGSEGYEAVRLGRKFIGIELKESYFKTAINNIESLKEEKKQEVLF